MAQGKDDVDFLSTKYLNENVINEEASFKALVIL
jgi:uncharacterized protein